MSDADIDVDMPEQEMPLPNEQPEDPLPLTEGVDEDPASEEDEAPAVEMKIKEIVPDAEVFNDAEAQAPPKKARVKRPISDKQRAHLAKIRIKAVEAKKAKAKAKPQKSAKKVYEEQVEDEHEEVDNVPPQKMGGITLSPDELRQLQYEAIYGYDTHRKAQKAEKKKKEAQDAHEKKTYRAVANAINRPVDDDGWGVCFQ